MIEVSKAKLPDPRTIADEQKELVLARLVAMILSPMSGDLEADGDCMAMRLGASYVIAAIPKKDLSGLVDEVPEWLPGAGPPPKPELPPAVPAVAVTKEGLKVGVAVPVSGKRR